MGYAVAHGAIVHEVLVPGEILVAEVDPKRRAALEQLGCTVTDRATDTTSCPQIMLALKPQVFAQVAASMGPLPQPTVVISIMAGLGSKRIRQVLGDLARIVRVMPNMPCQIGAGVTAVAIGAGAQSDDTALAVQLFEALGQVVMVEEDQMHAVTAVSGSGPAYVFLLAEAMHAAAIELGLDTSTARTLVEQTIVGAGRLLNETDRDAAALRQAVTSPGGTTAAALKVKDDAGWADTVRRAIAAARDRGLELDQ
jgi:pyrroline-5-carboxylate reductase